MNIKEIAARVNYYKCKRIPINWDRIKTMYNADRGTNFTAQELRGFYQNNFEKSLDDIYLIRKIVSITPRTHNEIHVEWEGFEVDSRDPQNYVSCKTLPIDIFEDFYQDHTDIARSEFSRLPIESLKRIMGKTTLNALKLLVADILEVKSAASDNIDALNKVEHYIINAKECTIELQTINFVEHINFDFAGEKFSFKLESVKRRKQLANYVLDFLFATVLQKFSS